ncbi:MAG TPA: hypothetical protein VIU37_04580 [Candidatus Limnocylindrales bacterium]
MFYRIDGVADGEFGGLSSARFVQLCERLFAYRGAMRARAQQQADQDARERPAAAAGPARAPAAGRTGEVREVGSSRAELRRDPVLASVIDF